MPVGHRSDIDAAEWIAAVRGAMKLTQPKFADLLEVEGGRDTVAKWEGGVEPRFTYTRRLVLVAPPPMLGKFLGKTVAPKEVSDPEHMIASADSAGAYKVNSNEAGVVAAELDAIGDPAIRRRAMTEAMNAIARVQQDPSLLDAGQRPVRAQHK